jgi:hypothetical protein
MALPYHKGNPNIDYKLMFVDVFTEFLDVHSNEPSERLLSIVRTVNCITALSAHPYRSGNLYLEGIMSLS